MQTSNNCHNNNNINNISTTNSSNDNIHTPPHTHNPTVTTNNFWMLSAYVPKPMGLGATLLITFKHCLYSCCAHRWSWTGLSIKWAHCGDRTTCHTTQESMKHSNETHVSCVCGHVPYNFWVAHTRQCNRICYNRECNIKLTLWWCSRQLLCNLCMALWSQRSGHAGGSNGIWAQRSAMFVMLYGPQNMNCIENVLCNPECLLW